MEFFKRDFDKHCLKIYFFFQGECYQHDLVGDKISKTGIKLVKYFTPVKPQYTRRNRIEDFILRKAWRL